MLQLLLLMPLNMFEFVAGFRQNQKKATKFDSGTASAFAYLTCVTKMQQIRRGIRDL